MKPYVWHWKKITCTDIPYSVSMILLVLNSWSPWQVDISYIFDRKLRYFINLLLLGLFCARYLSTNDGNLVDRRPLQILERNLGKKFNISNQWKYANARR